MRQRDGLLIGRGPIFGPLQDEDYFRTVAVGPYGHTFGWNLDDPGREIDFCPDATRIAIETRIVEEMSARYAARQGREFSGSPPH